MPKTKPAMAVSEYAILGVLQEAPAHGYRIAQRFAPGQDVGLLCPLEHSNVYALLHELQEQGSIRGQQIVVGVRPPRTVFALTPAGEAVVQAWLAEPVTPLHRLRLDFLLKLYFIVKRSPEDAAVLIDRQLAVGTQHLNEMHTELATLAPESLEHLVVDSKRLAVQSFITWLSCKRGQLPFLA
ncbi:MAG: PadR family transcriptional regulator [Dehalococcoidia bacterium]